MTLSVIDLEDFQAHASFRLTLAPGVTVLWGETGAGKTALVRALRWLCLGGPCGGFLRHGAKEVRVALAVDGRRVARYRGKGRNGYRLGAKEYEAVRQEVPPQVARLINLLPLNFQGQLEPPFLLTSPAPEVARALDRVVSLELIDRTLSRLESGVRSAQQAAARAAQELDEARRAHDAYAWLPAAQAVLYRLDSIQDAIARKSHRIAQVRLSLEKLSQAQERADSAVANARHAATAAQAAARYRNALGRRAALAETLAGLSPRPPKGAPAGLDAAARRVRAALERRAVLVGVLEGLERQREVAWSSARRAGETANERKELAAGRCPLCGRGGG